MSLQYVVMNVTNEATYCSDVAINLYDEIV